MQWDRLSVKTSTGSDRRRRRACPGSTYRGCSIPFYPERELHYYWKSIYLDGLSSDVIEAIDRRFRARPSPISQPIIWALGGAMDRVGESYERLVATKKKYDPTNPFWLNQNIDPGA